MLWAQLTTLTVAAASAIGLTSIAIFLSSAIGFVDYPDANRKTHKKPVALGGGVAVLLAALIGIAVGWNFLGEETVAENAWTAIGLLTSALLLCLVGAIDDRKPIRGKYKLLWQVAAASLVIGAGVVIEKITIFGVTFELGLLGVLLTMLWLLAAINSLNLIDGVDGLAASVGLIFSATLGIMATLHGHYFAAMASFAITGALGGFLPFNLPNAKIYLGDAGSTVLGLLLGTLALQCSFKEAATVAFAAPLALWAIPIFDSVVAIARRTLTGRSIYATDRGHIHHRLLTRGLAAWQALGIVAGLCLVTSAAALASIYYQREIIGIAAAGLVIAALIATRVFGHVELILLNNALVGLGRSWVPFTNRPDSASTSSVQLQGNLAWEKLWETLVESADRFGLADITLNLHSPSLHEDFYATWQRRERVDEAASWQISVPLNIQGQAAGRLRVVGETTWDNTSVQLHEFLEFVEILDGNVSDIINAGACVDHNRSSIESESTEQKHPGFPERETSDQNAVPASRSC